MVQYDTSCAYDFKPNTWKRHTGWLLVKARAAETLVEDCRRPCRSTATTSETGTGTVTHRIGQGDPRLDEYR